MKLKISKGAPGEKDTQKTFFTQFWFNGRACKHKVGKISQRFGTKECNDYLIDLFDTHTDRATRLWIKDPNETRRNEARIVEKPDTTTAKDYTVNEVIEAYCGASIFNEEAERGFSKDRRDGYRSSKHAREWFRCMVGYNNRDTLVRFFDDDDGYGVAEFRHNPHLRIAKPLNWRDFFRKYPPGRGIVHDKEYYNRRKKITYTKKQSKNYSIYDHDLGKSKIHELKPEMLRIFVKTYHQNQ